MLKKNLNIAKTIVYTVKFLFKKNKPEICIIVFISIISGFLPIISLKITQSIINSLQFGNKKFQYLMYLLVLLILINFVASVLRSINEYLRSKLSILVSYRMNYDLMKKSSSLPLEDLENTYIYDTLSRLQGEIESKPLQLFSSFLSITTIISTLIGSGIIFYAWNKTLFFSIIGFSIIHMLFYIDTGKKEFSMKYKRSSQERKVWYYSFLLTHDIGFKEIKIFNLKNFFLNKYTSLVSIFIKQENNILKKRCLISFIFSVFEIFVVFFVMFFSIVEIFSGVIEIGTGLLYINTISLLQSSIQSFTGHLFSSVDSGRYMVLFKRFMEYPEKKNGSDEIDSIKEIKLQNVNFSYSNKLILKNINLKLKKNDVLAIVGENGSGKSTLLKLIIGLYTPESGQIMINNINMNKISFNSYNKQVSCLFQDFLKYQGTVRENILLSNIHANDEDILLSLSKSNINFFHIDQKKSLNTQLGNWFENGNELSGGQWQKIALARFFLREGSLICLDEPSSALDKKSELKIFDTFFESSKNKIAIFVTHKIKIAKKASHIIVIKDGKIIATGSHKKLIQQSKYYRYLYDMENK